MRTAHDAVDGYYNVYRASSSNKTARIYLFPELKYVLSIRWENPIGDGVLQIAEIGTYHYGRNTFSMNSPTGNSRQYAFKQTFFRGLEELFLMEESLATSNLYSVKDFKFTRYMHTFVPQ